MKHGLTTNAIWDLNNTKWRKWLSLFHLSYLISLMDYLGSQLSPNVQINNYFMFDWSIYRLTVLNRCRKLDSLQTMIFVYVCSTWSIVEIKILFETWITRNDVIGVILIHIPYLITLMAYLCSQWTPNLQIKYIIIDWCWIGAGNLTLSK
jgi:hypothetical protein